MSIGYDPNTNQTTGIPFSNGEEEAGLVTKKSEGGAFTNESVGEYGTALSAANKAKQAQNAAELAETNAATSETNAASSATNAASSASAASTAETNANTSATNAATSASTATTQAGIATTKAGEASTSAGTATTQAGIATTKAGEASTSAGTATTQAGIATTKAGEAATSATAATTSASNAATSESNAASSESSVATSASNAATSESNAATSESNAATSESNAATSESNAATSASSASTSASNAASSASTTTTQASNAATSATQAAVSASSAATSESNANASATNAATSESNAGTSATQASTSASVASTSESNAAASKNAAATSATSASTSASTASTQAANAATSASSASTSASSAATSASNASTAKTAAEAAKDAALAALDNFDDRYLGTKTSDPTTDNDGNALVAGALYFNTADDVMKVYEGSLWVAAYASLAGALLQENNLSDVASAATSRTNLGVPAISHTHTAADVTDFDTEVSNNSSVTANTAKVTNVTTNLGYTTASATGTVTSSDGTNATLPAATTTLAGLQTGADKTKLNSIETNADVTDVTNVTAAGAAMLTGATFTGSITATDFVGPLNGAVQFTAKNTSGGTITKGQAIAISGISGNTPTVTLADADATTMPAFGLAATTAADNLELEIITFGSLKGVQTDYTGWALGDTLYISTTAGTLTNSAPSGEAAKIQNIGTVERLHSSNGTIKVGGAGRSNATPNLNDGNIFIGNAQGQSVTANFAAKVNEVVDALPDQTGHAGKSLVTDGSIASWADPEPTEVTMHSFEYTATAGQTVFSGVDLDGQTLANVTASNRVYLDGIQLSTSDYSYTASSVTLNSGASVGQELVVVVFDSFTVADHYSKAEADAKYLNKQTGGTIAGDVDVIGTVTADGLVVDGNVGIGTSSPDTDLHVEASTPVFRLTNPQTTSTLNLSMGKIEWETRDTSAPGVIGYIDVVDSNNFGTTFDMAFATGQSGSAAERMRISAAGDVGIGTSSPATALDVTGTVTADDLVVNSNNGATKYSNGGGTIYGLMYFNNGTNNLEIKHQYVAGGLVFSTNSSERMRIDSNGALLVGKTNDLMATQGTYIGANGVVEMTAASTSPLRINRLTSDGAIVEFKKDGTAVGSIGTYGGASYYGGPSGGLMFNGVDINPTNGTSTRTDGTNDIGASNFRFNDIYATNGTIQTSDRNEKQDIQAITEAEANVARVCKGLLRSFRWQDAVAEKGDDARIHFGIIAQDLQAAFEAEGLDAGRYAMFISTTWWEADREVEAVIGVAAVYETVVTTPAVETQDAVMGERQVMETVEIGTYINLAGETITESEERGVTDTEMQAFVERQTDEDGVVREVEVEREVKVPVMESYEVTPAVEAVAEVTEERLVSDAVEATEAYTVTDHFDTLEEAPEGATERTRLGVRYPELLAFIIAAL